ncbi:MAG TPA: efflux RND transporter periplasmic adaptor subunit [Dongiaceae bacterium]|nr:efflux RND transporter periplasmic adaptor subunit [Dongiaceae bacterium]
MDMPLPKKISPETISDPLTVRRPKATLGGLIIRLILVVALVAAVLGGLYYFEKFKEGMIAQIFSQAPPPTPVAAVEVVTKAVPNYLDGIGSIHAVHQVTISPEVSGRIVKIMFESGQSVQAGDPLIQLNDEPEQADLTNFQAQARLAQVTLDRNRKLATQQFTAQQTVDQNQSDLAVAQAGIARVKAVIAQKLVRAAFAGDLGVRQVEVGQYLGAGTPIVTLTNLDTLYVDFTLPEQVRSQLAVGQAVEVRVDAFKDRVFQAKLTTIEPQLDPEMRSIKLQATLDNPEHLLLPGMFAAARVILAAQPNVMVLPETAVDYSAYGESVYVLTPKAKGKDGQQIYTAAQTFVKTGPRRNGMIAITDGLKPGDLVVSEGQVKLQNAGPDVVVTGSGSLQTPATTPIN